MVNATEVRWRDTGSLGAFCDFEGKRRFPELGINLNVLQPGQPMGLYHRENAQEDFLVLAGTCLLIVEGEERELKTWDFFHSPPQTEHVIVGAGTERAVVLAVGSRGPRPQGPGLPGVRGGAETRRRRRAGDDEAGRGLRELCGVEAVALPGGLAPRPLGLGLRSGCRWDLLDALGVARARGAGRLSRQSLVDRLRPETGSLFCGHLLEDQPENVPESGRRVRA